ncbi:hypothetical protein GW17_00052992, partial [Ensete ventricosum]
PVGAAPASRSVVCKGYRMPPTRAAPARDQSAEEWRLWRCHPREQSRPQGRLPVGKAAAACVEAATASTMQ